MYGQVEGYIIPCQWGVQNKVMGHILFNDDVEDIVIRTDYVPDEVVARGLKVRLTGKIGIVNGYREILVEQLNVLDESEKG